MSENLGSLRYCLSILQTDEGSTHEKLDFRIHFPCSAFLVAVPRKG